MTPPNSLREEIERVVVVTDLDLVAVTDGRRRPWINRVSKELADLFRHALIRELEGLRAERKTGKPKIMRVGGVFNEDVPVMLKHEQKYAEYALAAYNQCADEINAKIDARIKELKGEK